MKYDLQLFRNVNILLQKTSFPKRKGKQEGKKGLSFKFFFVTSYFVTKEVNEEKGSGSITSQGFCLFQTHFGLQ